MTLQKIVSEVSEYYSVPERDIFGRSRDRHVAHARQTAMYLARKIGMSLPKIGRELERDHTTVLYGIREVAKRMKADVQYELQVLTLSDDLKEF